MLEKNFTLHSYIYVAINLKRRRTHTTRVLNVSTPHRCCKAIMPVSGDSTLHSCANAESGNTKAHKLGVHGGKPRLRKLLTLMPRASNNHHTAILQQPSATTTARPLLKLWKACREGGSCNRSESCSSACARAMALLPVTEGGNEKGESSFTSGSEMDEGHEHGAVLGVSACLRCMSCGLCAVCRSYSVFVCLLFC